MCVLASRNASDCQVARDVEWARQSARARRMTRKKYFIDNVDDLLSYCTLQSETGCRCWPGAHDADGYGMLYFGKRQWRAPRLVWTLTRGPIPPRMVVCHTCDNPPCCEPRHLWLGTIKQNSHDMVAKGRQPRCGPTHPATGESHGSRTHPERVPRGDRSGLRLHPERAARGARNGSSTHPEQIRRGSIHGRAKLTEADVILIRIRHQSGTTCGDLSRDYQVDWKTMSNLLKRKTWAHVP
jgi:HNH endonuclease